MFKLGKIVKIRKSVNKQFVNLDYFHNNIFVICEITSNNYGEWYKVRDPWDGYVPQIFFIAEELILVNNLCPVCNQEIKTENNKIKEHKHNNEVCYGSYMPFSV